jgi:TPR repeat protein
VKVLVSGYFVCSYSPHHFILLDVCSCQAKGRSITMIRAAGLLRNRLTNAASGLVGVTSRREHSARYGVFVVAISAAALTSASSDRNSQRLTNTDISVSEIAAAGASLASCDSEHALFDDSRPYPEPEEFRQCLEYYRQQLPWYRKQWSKSQNPISANWPRNIPAEDDISGLEFDLTFCTRNPSSKNGVNPKCQDLQFRIASFYIQSQYPKQQYRGYKLVKELAEQGYADGMCLYGIVLNEGRVTGIDANPEQAVVWWRRCADDNGHIPSLYELAVALYTGEGIQEDPKLAFKYFHKAANLHVGAAYMLGECLLDGVGVERHRAAALEWLIVAAELGHRGAQARALAILEAEGPDYGEDATVSETEQSRSGSRPRNITIERRFTDGGGNTLERRFTIGGGSRNPRIKKRRHSIVKDSREDGTNES